MGSWIGFTITMRCRSCNQIKALYNLSLWIPLITHNCLSRLWWLNLIKMAGGKLRRRRRNTPFNWPLIPHGSIGPYGHNGPHLTSIKLKRGRSQHAQTTQKGTKCNSLSNHSLDLTYFSYLCYSKDTPLWKYHNEHVDGKSIYMVRCTTIK